MVQRKKSSAKTFESMKSFLDLKNVYSAIVLVLFGLLSVLLFNKFQNTSLEKNDHKLPLKVSNITYCNNEKLDVMVPNNYDGAKKPPLVIYVHGGGWRYGSKAGGSAPYFYKLIKSNIAVASINYRLSGVAKFPEPVKDVLCAVKYLRANASMLGYDANNIFLAGQSSGANLVLMAGLADADPIFEQKNYSGISGKVQGVIALDAHYDLNYAGLSKDTKLNIELYLNGKSNFLEASPINYLSKNSPDMLVFHGIKDNRIPVESAREFEQNAKLSGAKVNLIEVKDADHNLNSLLGRDRPDSNQRLEIIKNFIFESSSY